MSQECEVTLRDGLPSAAAALFFSQSPLPLGTHPPHPPHPLHSPTIFAQMSHFLLSLREHQKHHKLRHPQVDEDDDEEGPYDLSGTVENKKSGLWFRSNFTRVHLRL